MVKGQNNFLSENGHVAYQIRANDTYNNTQVILLSLLAPSIPGGWVKTVFFSESSHAAYQIKANETYDDMQPNILSLHTLCGV